VNPGLWHRMDLLARQITPVLLTLALVLINALPLHLPGFARIAPLLPLMAIYHWAIFRPRLLPASAVFLIGVLQDVLSGTPIGVNALVFLAVFGAVLTQKRFLMGRSFAILWLGFALIAAGALAISWAAISILNLAVVEPRTAIFQYVLTLGLFPGVAWMFMRWQRAFLKQA